MRPVWPNRRTSSCLLYTAPSSADSREGVGADIAWDNGLRDDDVLLVPPPFDSLYPHYLHLDVTDLGRV